MTHILIADPDPRTRQALALRLERKLGQIQAAEAWDRASLEHHLATRHPDTLLLDCHLPGVTLADITSLLTRQSCSRFGSMSADADDLIFAQSLNAPFIYKGALPDEVLATRKRLVSAKDVQTT